MRTATSADRELATYALYVFQPMMPDVMQGREFTLEEWRQLIDKSPDTQLVTFVDGLQAAWERAQQAEQ